MCIRDSKEGREEGGESSEKEIPAQSARLATDKRNPPHYPLQLRILGLFSVCSSGEGQQHITSTTARIHLTCPVIVHFFYCTTNKSTTCTASLFMGCREYSRKCNEKSANGLSLHFGVKIRARCKMLGSNFVSGALSRPHIDTQLQQHHTWSGQSTRTKPQRAYKRRPGRLSVRTSTKHSRWVRSFRHPECPRNAHRQRDARPGFRIGGFLLYSSAAVCTRENISRRCKTNKLTFFFYPVLDHTRYLVPG